MKTEKIIANIEKYVNTLNAGGKNDYMQALKTAEERHQPVKECYKNFPDPILELVEIVQELKQELKEKALKETQGSTYLKRSKLVSKLLAKCPREDMQKAFNQKVCGEDMQCCIIDGYYALAFRNPLDLPMAESGGFTIEKVIPDYSYFNAVEYDIAEVKATLKLHKVEKKKGNCIIKINKKFYNAQYFCNVVEALGENVTFYQGENPLGMDVFENKNGIATLCPVRPPVKEYKE